MKNHIIISTAHTKRCLNRHTCACGRYEKRKAVGYLKVES